MINDVFYDSKKRSLNELLETISKGIDLLTNSNLDQELCNAFEKYALSAIRMVDAAYMTNYELNFSSNIDSPYSIGGFGSPFGRYANPFDQHTTSYQSRLANSASSIGKMGIGNSREYQEKVKLILQKLTAIIKGLINE